MNFHLRIGNRLTLLSISNFGFSPLCLKKLAKFLHLIKKHLSKTDFSNSMLVAAGIFASRIVGFVRQRIFGHFLGISDAADIFNTAFGFQTFFKTCLERGSLGFILFLFMRGFGLRSGKGSGKSCTCGTFNSFTCYFDICCYWNFCSTGTCFNHCTWVLKVQEAPDDSSCENPFSREPGFWSSAWCLGILNSHRRFSLITQHR